MATVTASYPAGLRLRPVPVPEAHWLLAGGRPRTPDVRLHPDYPGGDTLDALAMLLRAYAVMSPGPLGGPPPWWMHQIVVDQVVVGDIGFHGPPSAERPRTVEIGYNVVPAWRRRGVATRACALVLALAWADGADRVIAETEPDNVVSQRVLLANRLLRRQDGVFTLDRPPCPG